MPSFKINTIIFTFIILNKIKHISQCRYESPNNNFSNEIFYTFSCDKGCI